MMTVVNVFDNLKQQIRQDFPHVTELPIRSDNGGCYAGGAIIVAREQICD
ncbi:unnamed protein product, partial [Didymodactylos carnosus]